MAWGQQAGIEGGRSIQHQRQAVLVCQAKKGMAACRTSAAGIGLAHVRVKTQKLSSEGKPLAEERIEAKQASSANF